MRSMFITIKKNVFTHKKSGVEKVIFKICYDGKLREISKLKCQ